MVEALVGIQAFTFLGNGKAASPVLILASFEPTFLTQSTKYSM